MTRRRLTRVRATGRLVRRPVALLAAVAAVALLAPWGLARDGKRARVARSILGVEVGASLEEAHEKLEALGTSSSKESGEERDGEEGRKEAWTLRETDYSALALGADDEGRVVWVSGFVRPGRDIPFSDLGDVASAVHSSDMQVVWNVETPDGGYRLVAKGSGGRARVVYLLSLAADSR